MQKAPIPYRNNVIIDCLVNLNIIEQAPIPYRNNVMIIQWGEAIFRETSSNSI